MSLDLTKIQFPYGMKIPVSEGVDYIAQLEGCTSEQLLKIDPILSSIPEDAKIRFNKEKHSLGEGNHFYCTFDVVGTDDRTIWSGTVIKLEQQANVHVDRIDNSGMGH